MGKQEPESEHWLRKDVEDSVGNDLGINVDVAGTVSDTPDTATGKRYEDETLWMKQTLGTQSRGQA